MASKRKKVEPHKPFWMVKNSSGNKGAVKVQMPVAGGKGRISCFEEAMDGENASCCCSCFSLKRRQRICF